MHNGAHLSQNGYGGGGGGGGGGEVFSLGATMHRWASDPRTHLRAAADDSKCAVIILELPLEGCRWCAECNFHRLKSLEVVRGRDTRLAQGIWSIENFKLIRLGRLNGVADLRSSARPARWQTERLRQEWWESPTAWRGKIAVSWTRCACVWQPQLVAGDGGVRGH